jgi:hypothetical protein
MHPKLSRPCPVRRQRTDGQSAFLQTIYRAPECTLEFIHESGPLQAV